MTINVDATDIRSSGSLDDYTGELQAQVTLRVTDRNNSPLPPIFPDDQPGTVQDTPLSVTVPCTATPSTSIGSQLLGRHERGHARAGNGDRGRPRRVGIRSRAGCSTAGSTATPRPRPTTCSSPPKECSS